MDYSIASEPYPGSSNNNPQSPVPDPQSPIFPQSPVPIPLLPKRLSRFDRTGESRRSVSRTLFLYILGEAFFSFLISFLFFFFIFFVNQLLLMAQEILVKHVPFHQVALLVLFSLPQVIALSAPFASLVGLLMTVGRLSSDNEVLVMLSSGLSYRNVFVPAITVGFVIFLFSFVANDILLPGGYLQFHRLYRRILISTPALELEPHSVKKYNDTVIVTGNVKGNAIDNLLILDRTSDGERRVIMANNAELKDMGTGGLALDLTRAFVHSSKAMVREDYDYASASSLRYLVPQEDLMQGTPSVSPREMSSRDVYKEIVEKTAELDVELNERKNRLSSVAIAYEDTLRRGSSSENWNRRTNQFTAFQREVQTLEDMRSDRSLSLYWLEFYKKFSVPFGAFSFVFLAVALGLMAKKSGQTVGFLIGLIISVVYWVLLFGGQTMGIRMNTPPFWAMWTPNILALAAGFILTLVRVLR